MNPEILYYTILKSPIGPLMILSTDQGVFSVQLWAENETAVIDRFRKRFPDTVFSADERINREAAEQLKSYFDGKQGHFTLKLDPEMTPFQKEALHHVTEIPAGETRTYGQIASAMGKPKASRAVGMANRNNPLPVIIPCHRVIGADGSLTGYAGKDGVKTKAWLLEHEQKMKR